MKAKFITFLCLLSFFSINAQILLEIENDKITLDEFKNVFFKNSHEEEIDTKYLDEYMDLFINFKLKVYEAKQLKMDTITSFINELDGYAEQLSIPYLKNKEFDESLVNEAYERMKLDIEQLEERLIQKLDRLNDDIRNVSDSFDSYKRTANRTTREMKNDITTLRDDLTIIDKQLNPKKYEEKKK